VRTRAWVGVGVVMLAIAAAIWASCEDPREAPVARPEIVPSPLVTARLPPAAEPEPPPVIPVIPVLAEPRQALDAGFRVRVPNPTPKARTNSNAVPPVVRKAFDAALAECEKKVTRWFSGEGYLPTIELEATDAGVSIGFSGNAPIRRCLARLLKPQRFEVELTTPKSVVAFLDTMPKRGDGALPGPAEVVALIKKCVPPGSTMSSLSLRMTAVVRGSEVVVDRPVLESKELDAWARSCIELALMRTIPFNEDSRPTWTSVTIEIETDELGKNSRSHMTYEPP
jgi:hypothetical protein